MSTLAIGEILSVLLLVSSLAILTLGFGVAFSLAAIGIVFAGLGAMFGAFEFRLLQALPFALTAMVDMV